MNFVKRQKRAETRNCPICSQHIPVRLLNAHAVLESRRVDEIINSIGSEHVFSGEMEPSTSSRSRRSAEKARHSISIQSCKSLDNTTKTLQTLKRRRKQRGLKLREIANQAEDAPPGAQRGGEQSTCPVCLEEIHGDDVNDHVDACLLAASARIEIEPSRESSGSEGNYVGDLPGAGFHRRSVNQADVEEDVDIDGDDELKYGRAQFSEQDVRTSKMELDAPSNAEASSSELKQGKAKVDAFIGLKDIELVDEEIEQAKSSGDTTRHLAGLEEKIKLLEILRLESSTSAVCRICLDPYTEPTVSIGCFHTSCRECWLRCLGSAGVCPICKRITSATELRRVYL